jgi:hypothetical protein
MTDHESDCPAGLLGIRDLDSLRYLALPPWLRRKASVVVKYFYTMFGSSQAGSFPEAR